MTEAHHPQQRYRVLERLNSGGMAEVFIAESAGIEGFKKQVAIKRVLPHLSEKKRFIAMFLDEARLSAHLSHSNVVQVFDIGVGDNAYFIVMEYVDGADLKGVIEYMRQNGRAFPVEAAVYIVAKMCEGLSYAHELKGTDGTPLRIVHRDVSPPNVLITKYGEIKIVDFGLAKATSQLAKSEAGIIKGKFSYLAPEAALGGEVDHRADVFAVGIILWEILAGRRLFLGESDFQTVKLVQQAAVPPLSKFHRDVPPELESIVARALAQDPDRRYQTARDLARDLTGFLFRFGRPVTAWDIAELVRGAMSVRKKTVPDKASIIDKLIEEALLEFTSLQKGDQPAPAAAAKPSGAGGGAFEDLSKWTDEILTASSDQSVVAQAPQVEEGNLAALEDDDPAPVSAVHTLEPSPTPSQVETVKAPDVKPIAPSKAPAATGQGASTSNALAPVDDDLDKPLKPSGGGATKAILVLIAIAILAAGAYFGGLFGK